MRTLWCLAVAALVVACAHPAPAPVPVAIAPSAGDSLSVVLRVDSARHEIVVDAGPFRLPAMPSMEHEMAMMHGDMAGMQGDMAAMYDSAGHAPADHESMHHGAVPPPGMTHGSMSMMHHGGPPSRLLRFDWPVDGWLRGYRITVVDAKGNPIPGHLLHHVIGVNYSRRQLEYPALERPFAIGSETGDITLPKPFGVPMARGQHLGMWAMWHNETGKPIEAAYLRATFLWMPANQHPKPVAVLPMYIDVNYVSGGDNAFDLPPGHTTKSYEFTQPVSGRLIGIGGHLHDYGLSVRLEDAQTGRTLVKLYAEHDDKGSVTGVSKRIFLKPLRLVAGHRYRVVGEYDNLLDDTIPLGAMAHMVGAFEPDNLADWPKIDPTDPRFQKDVASIPPFGAEAVVAGAPRPDGAGSAKRDAGSGQK